jgi:hypothetical protein
MDFGSGFSDRRGGGFAEEMAGTEFSEKSSIGNLFS